MADTEGPYACNMGRDLTHFSSAFNIAILIQGFDVKLANRPFLVSTFGHPGAQPWPERQSFPKIKIKNGRLAPAWHRTPSLLSPFLNFVQNGLKRKVGGLYVYVCACGRVSRGIPAVWQEQGWIHIVQGARSRDEVAWSKPDRRRTEGYDQRGRCRRSVIRSTLFIVTSIMFTTIDTADGSIDEHIQWFDRRWIWRRCETRCSMC